LPSLIGQDDEAFLRSHHLVEFERVSGAGDNILQDRPDAVVAAVRRVMIGAVWTASP
jgi:hypothetical protein